MSHMVNANNYIFGIDAILTAGRRLQRNLEAEAKSSKLEYAITGLEQAAEQHEANGTEYQAFMFSELAETTDTDKETRARMMEDVLAGVLTDLQVANVLMAAGQAVGETGDSSGSQKLGEALVRLDTTSRVVEQSLASPLKGGAESGRFGFTELSTEPEVLTSQDLPAAIEAFKKRSSETLAGLLDDAKEVVMSVVKALSEIDSDKVLAAISKLGGKVGELGGVGRLFKQGVKKLKSAINALLRLLGEDLLDKVKAQVQKVWEDLKGGQYVAGPLAWAFGIEATRTEIEQILGAQGFNPEAMDDASKEAARVKVDEATLALAKLRLAFRENMKILSGVVAAVSFAGTFLFVVPVLGQHAALVAASIDAIILGATILIGMDYTDSGVLLKRVRGVREIAKGLTS